MMVMSSTFSSNDSNTSGVTTGSSGFDDLASFVSQLPGAGVHARNSALGSVGYMLKSTLKETVNSNTAGWPTISVATRAIATNPPRATARYTGPRLTRAEWEQRRADQRMTNALNAATTNGGRMLFWGSIAAGAIFDVDKDGGTVDFGFKEGVFGFKTRRRGGTTKREANVIGRSFVELCRVLTEGTKAIGTPFRVDRQMQKYLRAIGLYSPRLGAEIHIPPRPLIGPHFQRVNDQIPALFREKFWASFSRRASLIESFVAGAAGELLPLAG